TQKSNITPAEIEALITLILATLTQIYTDVAYNFFTAIDKPGTYPAPQTASEKKQFEEKIKTEFTNAKNRHSFFFDLNSQQQLQEKIKELYKKSKADVTAPLINESNVNANACKI
ncbi:MAG: hypothetical protein ACK4PR_00810, partial [Gammaproteobacteria bacterium]